MSSMRTAALIVATTLVGPMARAHEVPAPMPRRAAELVKQLKDPDWDTRMEAATALGVMGAEAKSAIPYLLEALKDPVAPVRMKAIDALMFMRTAAAEAVPGIVPLLSDPDELVRVSVVVALPRMAADRTSVVPLLKKTLADPAWKVRRRAAIELIQLGAEVPAAVPVLREGLQDPMVSARLDAIGVLAKVGSPEERKAMTSIAAGYLKDPDPLTRVDSIRQLSDLGAEAVPHLIAVLRTDGDRTVQNAAIRALRRIGPEAKAALPVLRELAQERHRRLRYIQSAIAVIEGKEPRPPEEVVGPVPPLDPASDKTGAAAGAGGRGTPTPSPRPQR